MYRTRISMTLLPALALWITCGVAVAATPPGTPTIQIDENGNGIGTASEGYLADDPGPGGLPNVLTYKLPFTGVQGDVRILDQGGSLGRYPFQWRRHSDLLFRQRPKF